MLVCNVSLRPPRAGIAADLVEAVTATDATATGNVVFATLVDDPASVGEIVDAYLGEIMIEAASADAVVDAGLLYAVAIDEAVTAVDAPNAALLIPSARSAMIAGRWPVFVNPGSSREANAQGIMINI